MTRISAALAAMDKATPGPWIADLRGGCCAVYPESKEDQTPGCHKDDARNLFYSNKDAVYCEEGYWEMDKETQQNFVIAAAAPDALAWIKEALPWLERMREGTEAPLMVEPEKYDALCALIARAKPEEVGR